MRQEQNQIANKMSQTERSLAVCARRHSYDVSAEPENTLAQNSTSSFAEEKVKQTRKKNRTDGARTGKLQLAKVHG